jgi:hypothetical protein
MTTTAGEPRRDSRLLMLIGHYAWLAVAVSVIISITDDATERNVTPLVWAADAAWFAFIVAVVADFGYHTARLCERCIAGTPLDAQAAADRWKPVLRLAHARKARVAALMVLLGVNLTIEQVYGKHPPGWTYAVDAGLLLALGASFASDFRHRKLYPWCPYCHWGHGDGPREASPAPDPAMAA